MPTFVPSRLHPYLIVCLLVLGLFLPSSSESEPTITVFLTQWGLLAAGLAVLLARPGGVRGMGMVVLVLAMNLLLGVFTLLTPFSELTLGNYASRFLLSLVYLLDLRGLEGGRTLRSAWLAVCVFNVGLAFAILLEAPVVAGLLIDHYSAFYPELVPTMLELGKPVLTFATHSLAGFFFYLFFYVNFRTYTAERSSLHLVLALSFFGLGFFLKSVTVYGFAPVAALQLAWHFGFGSSSARSRLAAILVLLAVSGVLWEQRRSVKEAFDEVRELLTSDTSGLAARYGQGGVIAPSLDYIREHPLRPIGLGNAVEFTSWDSGIVENMTRGSLPLVLCVYGGLWSFLFFNLRSRGAAAGLFAAYLLFEVGFANLLYLRTLYFLPVIVVYLNGLLPAAHTLRAVSPGPPPRYAETGAALAPRG